MHFVRRRLGQKRLQFLKPDLILGAAAGGVQEDQIEMAHPLDGLPHLPRGRNDVHRQVDDIGVGPQLLDGGDAVGIDGDQAHAAFLLQPEIGGQLGDGRRLAHAGRTHQRPSRQRPGDLIRAGAVNLLLDHAGAEGLSDAMMLKAHVAGMIEEEIHVAGPIQITPGRCRLAALVGPTGVGKTTTIAKLAANFRLKEKRRVGLITVDTYRIAAVEQLRTYADIIDLPMHVVSTPREMRETVKRMSHLDLILLDTAGRSPKDEVRLQELKAFLTEAAADEVHLVLSSMTDNAGANGRAIRHGRRDVADSHEAR